MYFLHKPSYPWDETDPLCEYNDPLGPDNQISGRVCKACDERFVVDHTPTGEDATLRDISCPACSESLPPVKSSSYPVFGIKVNGCYEFFTGKIRREAPPQPNAILGKGVTRPIARLNPPPRKSFSRAKFPIREGLGKGPASGNVPRRQADSRGRVLRSERYPLGQR